MSDKELHFEEEWVSFALQLVPADMLEHLRAHLDTGCTECTRMCNLWNRVVETAARERLYEPPAAVLRAVKAAFPLVQKLPLLPRLARSAQMIFDSFREPLPEGVRGGRTDARHLLYQSNDFLIDLRLEHEEKERITVSGQILRKGASPASPTVAVLAAGGDGRALQHTVVNSLGEFQLGLANQDSITLYLQFPDSSIAHIGLASGG